MSMPGVKKQGSAAPERLVHRSAVEGVRHDETSR